MIRILFIGFAILLLIYLLIPGPTSIDNFSELPNSTKSTLSGDTIQQQNVAGYFSNNYRNFVTNFYKNDYSSKVVLPFLPIRLNYPPEFAYTAIIDQTKSTYLEEFVYPLRDSLFVNGFEPFYESGKQKFFSSTKFEQEGKLFYTKATLRYYPSPIWVRITVWLGILVSMFLIWKTARRVISRG
ncbi:MAG: hypothetical protein PHQ59_02925 [Candidatus Daviesbacteria bacterium]|nr:hypothetical protein [Candidatus Daviesbacteria bacterium]